MPVKSQKWRQENNRKKTVKGFKKVIAIRHRFPDSLSKRSRIAGNLSNSRAIDRGDRPNLEKRPANPALAKNTRSLQRQRRNPSHSSPSNSPRLARAARNLPDAQKPRPIRSKLGSAIDLCPRNRFWLARHEGYLAAAEYPGEVRSKSRSPHRSTGTVSLSLARSNRYLAAAENRRRIRRKFGSASLRVARNSQTLAQRFRHGVPAQKPCPDRKFYLANISGAGVGSGLARRGRRLPAAEKPSRIRQQQRSADSSLRRIGQALARRTRYLPAAEN